MFCSKYRRIYFRIQSIFFTFGLNLKGHLHYGFKRDTGFSEGSQRLCGTERQNIAYQSREDVKR
jgi:hypothetical protein